MDKRKAYAIMWPCTGGALVRDGHKKKIEQRYLSALYCDGTSWYATVERVGSSFRPELLRTLPASAIDRMAQIAAQLLIACDCGDGQLQVGRGTAYTIVAMRQMTPSEQAALPPARAVG